MREKQLFMSGLLLTEKHHRDYSLIMGLLSSRGGLDVECLLHNLQVA